MSGHQTDLATDDLADRVRAHRALAQQPGRTRRGQINDGGRQCAGDVTLDINPDRITQLQSGVVDRGGRGVAGALLLCA